MRLLFNDATFADSTLSYCFFVRLFKVFKKIDMWELLDVWDGVRKSVAEVFWFTLNTAYKF